MNRQSFLWFYLQLNCYLLSWWELIGWFPFDLLAIVLHCPPPSDFSFVVFILPLFEPTLLSWTNINIVQFLFISSTRTSIRYRFDPFSIELIENYWGERRRKRRGPSPNANDFLPFCDVALAGWLSDFICGISASNIFSLSRKNRPISLISNTDYAMLLIQSIHRHPEFDDKDFFYIIIMIIIIIIQRIILVVSCHSENPNVSKGFEFGIFFSFFLTSTLPFRDSAWA